MTVAEIQIQTVNSADVMKSEQDASDVSRASVFVGRDPQVRLRYARDSFFKRLRNILLMPTWCLQPLCSNWGSDKRQALGLTATVQGLSRDSTERSLPSSRAHHQKLQPPHLSLVLQSLRANHATGVQGVRWLHWERAVYRARLLQEYNNYVSVLDLLPYAGRVKEFHQAGALPWQRLLEHNGASKPPHIVIAS